jgi:hypothetical protein
MEPEVLGEQLPEDIYVRPDHEYDVSVSWCVSWLQVFFSKEKDKPQPNTRTKH